MSAAGVASGGRARTPRIAAWAVRPGDARLAARARLLAPGSVWVRLLFACARGGSPLRALAALRTAAAIAGALACLVAAVAGGGAVVLTLSFPAAVAAAALPGCAIGGAVRRGAAAAEGSLPLALEVIAASMHAGLPLDRALALITGCVAPSLGTVVSEAVALAAAGDGLPSRGLAAAAEASGLEDLASVAALIDRRMRLGLPVAPPLLAVADSVRARVRARTLARAARRGPLAGLVTAVVVAPACALGLLTLVLAGLLTGGHLLGPG
jgi:Flp pilus assembly protein TadB